MKGRKYHPLLPDFLVIGAGKSGTTSVDNYLKQHPQLFLPAIKEPNFFGYELKRSSDFDDPDERFHYQNSVTDLHSYLDLFRGADDSSLKGETSNTYLYHEQAPERIQHYNPDMKLIAILRHPVHRLWSRYLHLARVNQLPQSDFSECRVAGSIWWKRQDLIPEGFYYRNLSRYYNHFPSAQIKIYLHEALNDTGHLVMTDIFRFLGVDGKFRPRLDIRFNPSGFVKNKWVDRILGPSGFIQSSAKKLLKDQHFDALKNNPAIQNWTIRIRAKNLVKPRIDPEIGRFLLDEVYAKDIGQLQQLLGRDLSSWLDPASIG